MSVIPWADVLPRVSQSLGPALSAELAALPLPPLHRLEQRFPRDRVEDIRAAVREQLMLRPEIRRRIRKGAHVAVTAGSRGVGRMAEILRAVVDTLADCGADPFLIPAMGSHGGATAEGQVELLADYGITNETMGVPVVSSLATVELGRVLDGVRVFASADAAGADAVIPINRVKPHTGFRGPIESGVMKMLAIGVGKQHGAETLHAQGMERFDELIPAAAECMIRELRIPFGIGILENAYEEPARIVAMPSESIREQEAELLEEARARLPGLPFGQVDVLVVGTMGKNISGSGMDPNVIGRFFRGEPAGREPKSAVTRVAVLDVTPESHGNAVGIGAADVISLRLFSKLDLPSIYANSLTAAHTSGARIPVILESDRAAIAVSIKSCPRVNLGHVRLAVIRNTLELAELWCSPALVDDAQSRLHVVVDPEPRPMEFTAEGELVSPIGRRIK